MARASSPSDWLPESLRRQVDAAPPPTAAQRARLWQLIAPRGAEGPPTAAADRSAA